MIFQKINKDALTKELPNCGRVVSNMKNIESFLNHKLVSTHQSRGPKPVSDFPPRLYQTHARQPFSLFAVYAHIRSSFTAGVYAIKLTLFHRFFLLVSEGNKKRLRDKDDQVDGAL